MNLFVVQLFSYCSQTRAQCDLFFISMSHLEKEEEWQISRSQLKFMCLMTALSLLKSVPWVKFSFYQSQNILPLGKVTKQVFTKSSDLHLVFPLVLCQADSLTLVGVFIISELKHFEVISQKSGYGANLLITKKYDSNIHYYVRIMISLQKMCKLQNIIEKNKSPLSSLPRDNYYYKVVLFSAVYFQSLTLTAFHQRLRACEFVHALVFSESRILPASLLAVRREEGRMEISICRLCVIFLLTGTE